MAMVDHIDAMQGWTDAATSPPHGEPVLAEYHEWNDASKPVRQQVVWLWEGEYRPYPQTDSLAYCDRWKPLPTAALQAERDALAAILINIAATVTQDASGRWYFDLGDPEQLLSDACAAVGYDVVISARDALGE